MLSDPFYDDMEDSGIDLTPLIDVVFMLLIFFIMSTVFVKPSISIDLPVTEHAARQKSDGKVLVIAVSADGGYYHKDRQLTLEGLMTLLEEHPQAAVNLFVDRHAPFEPFIRFIDQAKAKGREEIVVTTEPEAQNP